MLVDSVGQEFKQSTAQMAHLCSMMSEASDERLRLKALG